MAVAIPAAAYVLSGALTGRNASLHEDGKGILASTGDPAGGWNYGVAPSDHDGPVSFGLSLCVADPKEAPVISRIRPAQDIGAVPSFVGASIRTFRPTHDDLPVIAAQGYPPSVPDSLADAVGYTITTPCSDPGAGDVTELLVGLVPQPARGGGWKGQVIEYRSGGQNYALMLNYGWVFCGPPVDDPICDPAPPQE